MALLTLLLAAMSTFWARAQRLRNNQIRSENAAKPDWQGAEREKFGRIASYVTGFFAFRNAARRDFGAFAVGFDYFSVSERASNVYSLIWLEVKCGLNKPS